MHVHLAFVTKYQRGVFNDEMLTRCEEIMRKACEDLEAEPKEFNGEPDHIHLLVLPQALDSVRTGQTPIPPKAANLKNGQQPQERLRPPDTAGDTSRPTAGGQFTSGRINPAITHGHLWSPPYFSASCGGTPLTIVRQYIEQQKRPL